MNYLLGIDVGTSATKTVLFDRKWKSDRLCFTGISVVSARERMGRAEA